MTHIESTSFEPIQAIARMSRDKRVDMASEYAVRIGELLSIGFELSTRDDQQLGTLAVANRQLFFGTWKEMAGASDMLASLASRMRDALERPPIAGNVVSFRRRDPS